MNYSKDWFSGNISVWEEKLRKFKGKSNLTFLEIGCYEGKATTWLLENILTSNSCKIHVVDTFMGSMEHERKTERLLLTRFRENIKRFSKKVIVHQGKSGEVLRTLGVKEMFDFIYIDGSHVAKDVLEDAILSWRLLKDHGVLIFDDYHWMQYLDELKQPKIAIDSFLKIYSGHYKLNYKMGQVIVTKKRVRIPTKFVDQLMFFLNGIVGAMKINKFPLANEVWHLYSRLWYRLFGYDEKR